jgi:hypothetical protein
MLLPHAEFAARMVTPAPCPTQMLRYSQSLFPAEKNRE